MTVTVVIDTCCLINLAAAGALDDWLPALDIDWKLPQAVFDEAIFLRGLDEDGKPTREPIEISHHIDSNLLTLVQPNTDTEFAAYIGYASQLDDGEAMAIAIAETHGWSLATDDRKAIQLADEANVEIITTAELISRWMDKVDVPPHKLSQVLLDIRNKARFIPHPKHALYAWWMQHLPNTD